MKSRGQKTNKKKDIDSLLLLIETESGKRKNRTKKREKYTNATKKEKSKKSKKTKSLKPEKNKNCLFCAKFRPCKDQNKSWNYLCGKFKEFPQEQLNALKTPNIQPESRQMIHGDEEEEELINFEKMMEQVLEKEARNPLPPDMRINDQDIPQAPNVFEWMTGQNFLNYKPYAKQVQIALHTYAEWCPRKSCTDRKFIFDIPKKATYDQIRERVTMLNFGKCPKCGGRKHDFLRKGKMKVPFEAAILAGQRSGKSALSVMMHTYTTHQFLKLQNAPKVFSLLENETLRCTFTAQSLSKAKELLFDKFKEGLLASPWYKVYHEMLDHYGNKYGEELYKIREMSIHYRARSIAISCSSPVAKSLRGATSYGASIDEIGLLDSTEKGEKLRASAKEVYTSLKNSFRTLRGAYSNLLKKGFDGLPVPMYINISSPWSKRDQMVKLYELSKKSRIIYGIHLATWEFNPTLSRRDFDDEFSTDPIKAMRDFGAVPPNSSYPFINEIDNLRAIINKKLRNAISISSIRVASKSKKIMTSGKIRFNFPKDNNKRILALDASTVNNHFAFAAGYRDTITGYPVIDCLGEIIPSAEYPINFTAVFDEVICPMIERLNIKYVATDRFQNKKIMDDIESLYHDVLTQQYSVKYRDMEAFRSDVYEGQIQLPKPEMRPSEIETAGENTYPEGFRNAPISHLLYQALTVQDLGKEVIKGPDTTDDLLRAAFLAYAFIVDPEFAEFCTGKVIGSSIRPSNYAGATTSRGIGSFMGGGGGGGGGGVVTGSGGRALGTVGSFAQNRR